MGEYLHRFLEISLLRAFKKEDVLFIFLALRSILVHIFGTKKLKLAVVCLFLLTVYPLPFGKLVSEIYIEKWKL